MLLVVGFHAWLFGDRLIAGTFLDPLVAVRWVVAATLGCGFLWLRRQGLSLVSGRRAVVLWLLVTLLHAHAAWTPAGAALDTSAREAAVAALQAASMVAAAAGLGLLGLLLKFRVGAPRLAARWLADGWPGAPVRSVFLAIAGPRPPPAF